MPTKNRVPEEFVTLKEERTVIREQDQVAETFNDYFTNIIFTIYKILYVNLQESRKQESPA